MKSILKFLVSTFAMITFNLPVLAKEIVTFNNGSLELKGELFKPEGKGPFPVLLINHGSAPGMLNSQASAAIAAPFVKRGWVVFMPYRRGQGLSHESGPYIMDEIKKSINEGGLPSGVKTLVRLNQTDHLSDQRAALKWIQTQSYIKIDQIAAFGNSFGGIQTMLGVTNGGYCAGVNAAGGAKSWSKAKPLQELMKEAARSTKVPVMFFQAENDFDLSPSKTLYQLMKDLNKDAVFKIYPPFGKTAKEGHSFPYEGVDTWFEDVFSFISERCLAPH
mgnify:CR=1 FL=1